MKFIYLLIISLQFLACNTNKEVLSIPKKTTATKCPENGNCSFEVMYNKSLELKTDGIGALYPVLNEGKKTVLKFEYKRDEIANTVDGYYSEIIYAEIDPNINQLELNNKNLSKAKVIFGRLCFCRGETGYYRIKDGALSIEKKDNYLYFNLSFKCNEVPQIISNISEIIN
ncbi:MAG: hypothetical protein COA88_08445 [Kordia sp.]|nr:MAG: hypothetical protein COA88_08445 [Kordia sp.]